MGRGGNQIVVSLWYIHTVTNHKAPQRKSGKPTQQGSVYHSRRTHWQRKQEAKNDEGLRLSVVVSSSLRPVDCSPLRVDSKAVQILCPSWNAVEAMLSNFSDWTLRYLRLRIYAWNISFATILLGSQAPQNRYMEENWDTLTDNPSELLVKAGIDWKTCGKPR